MLWSAKGEADEGGMDGDDGGGLMFYDSESSRRAKKMMMFVELCRNVILSDRYSTCNLHHTTLLHPPLLPPCYWQTRVYTLLIVLQ